MSNLYTKRSYVPDDHCRVHRVAIIMDKLSGSRHFKYLLIDDSKQILLPKVGHLTWPRLQDVVGFRITVLKNCLYVIGGKDKKTGKTVNQVLKYDPMKNRWLQCADLKQGRTEHAVAVMGGKIYVSGGLSQKNEPLFNCESYEPLIDEWSKEAPLLAPRAGHQMLERDKSLLLSGGNAPGSTNGTNTFWRTERSMDPADPHKVSFTWSSSVITDCHVALCNHLQKHVMVSYADKIFFFGGIKRMVTYDGETYLTPAEDERRMSRLDLTEEAKSEEKAKSQEVTLTSDVAQAFRLQSKPCISEVLHIDDTSDTSSVEVTRRTHRPWKQCRNMTTPRAGAGTVTIGNKIYLIGGHRSDDPEESFVNMVEFFNPRKNKWYEAFSLGEGSYREVECCVLSVPVTNKDFRHDALSYDWVMW